VNEKLYLDENILNQQLETYENLRQEWISQVWDERNRMLTSSKKKRVKSKKQTMVDNHDKQYSKKKQNNQGSKAHKSAYAGKKKKVKIHDRASDVKRMQNDARVRNTSSDEHTDKDWVFIENHQEDGSIEKAVAELNDDSAKRLTSTKKSPKSLFNKISSSNYYKSVSRICEEYGLLGILTSFISYLYMEENFFENRELRRIISKGLYTEGNLDALLKGTRTLENQHTVSMSMINLSKNEIIIYLNDIQGGKKKIFSLQPGHCESFETYGTQALL